MAWYLVNHLENFTFTSQSLVMSFTPNYTDETAAGVHLITTPFIRTEQLSS